MYDAERRMTSNTDVIVVGASLVAPAVCLALAGSGIRTTLLDTRPPARATNDPRPIALAQSSVRILQTLGIWAELAAQAEPIRSIHVSERTRFSKIRLRAEDSGVDAFGYVVNAGMVARAFAKRLQDVVEVDQIHVETLQWCGDSASAGLKVGHAAGGTDETIQAALLVVTELGANGISGLELTVREHDYDQVAIACAPRVARDHQGVAYERFTAQGPLALLPLLERRCGVVWTMSADAAAGVMALDDATFCAELASAAGHWLAPFDEPGARGMFPLRLRSGALVDRQARALLLGSAAVQLHPVAGQGLNLALRDAAELTDVLVNAHREGADLGALTLRETFVRARRSDRARVRTATDVLAQSFVSHWPGLRFARGSAMFALGLAPAIKSKFAEAAMGLSVPQPRLLRGLAP
jgi:2-octaprenyl-6-methoxyphenol hydroxylase